LTFSHKCTKLYNTFTHIFTTIRNHTKLYETIHNLTNIYKILQTNYITLYNNLQHYTKYTKLFIFYNLFTTLYKNLFTQTLHNFTKVCKTLQNSTQLDKTFYKTFYITSHNVTKLTNLNTIHSFKRSRHKFTNNLQDLTKLYTILQNFTDIDKTRQTYT